MMPPPPRKVYTAIRREAKERAKKEEEEDNQSNDDHSVSDRSFSEASDNNIVTFQPSSGYNGKPNFFSNQFLDHKRGRTESFFTPSAEVDDDDDEEIEFPERLVPKEDQKEKKKEAPRSFYENKTPISFSELSKMNIPKKRKLIDDFDTKRICWGCSNAFLNKNCTKSYTVKNAYTRISDIISNMSWNIEHEVLAQSIKNIWDKDIAPNYQITVHGQLKNPEWSVEEIEEHIFTHMCDPALTMRRGIAKLNVFSKILEDNIFYRDQNGKLYTNKENLQSYMMIESQKTKFHLTDPTKSIGFTSGLTPVPQRKKNLLL